VKGRRRWPGKDKGKVVPFSGTPGAEQEGVTPPQVLACALVGIWAAIARVAARLGTEHEREGDVRAVTSLVAACNDLAVGTRQTVERKC